MHQLSLQPGPLTSSGLRRAPPFPTAWSRPFFFLSLKKRTTDALDATPHLPHRASAWHQAPWKQPTLPLAARGPWQASAAMHLPAPLSSAGTAGGHAPSAAAGCSCSASWSFLRPCGPPHCSSAVSALLPQSSSPGLQTTLHAILHTTLPSAPHMSAAAWCRTLGCYPPPRLCLPVPPTLSGSVAICPQD